MLKKDQSSWSCLMRAKFKKEKIGRLWLGVSQLTRLWLRKWKSVRWHTTDCFLTTCFLPKWPFVWIMAMGIENRIQIVQSIRILCIWDLSIPFVVEFFVWDRVLEKLVHCDVELCVCPAGNLQQGVIAERNKQSKVSFHEESGDNSETRNVCRMIVLGRGGNTSNMSKHLSMPHGRKFQECCGFGTQVTHKCHCFPTWQVYQY